MKYREENGRRYHGYKDGAYLLPNDETEQNRLDLVSPTLHWLRLYVSHTQNQNHHVFTMVNKGRGGGLYRAPIDKPARVLDVGTGTGIWVMDFGEYDSLSFLAHATAQANAGQAHTKSPTSSESTSRPSNQRG